MRYPQWSQLCANLVCKGIVVDRGVGALSWNHVQDIRPNAISVPSKRNSADRSEQVYGEYVQRAHHECRCVSEMEYLKGWGLWVWLVLLLKMSCYRESLVECMWVIQSHFVSLLQIHHGFTFQRSSKLCHICKPRLTVFKKCLVWYWRCSKSLQWVWSWITNRYYGGGFSDHHINGKRNPGGLQLDLSRRRAILVCI